MSQYKIENPDGALERVGAVLQNWWVTRKDAENNHLLDARGQSFALASRLLGDVISAVYPDRQLCLTIGREAVRGVYIPASYHGFNRRQYEMLEPGSELTISSGGIHASESPWLHMVISRTLPREYYLGADSDIKVPVSAVAQTLTEGGTMTFIPKTQLAEQSAA